MRPKYNSCLPSIKWIESSSIGPHPPWHGWLIIRFPRQLSKTGRWYRQLFDWLGLPGDLAVFRDERGKPQLKREYQLSISHSRDREWIVLARGGPLGLDIEAVDRPGRIPDIIFSPAEQAVLRRCPISRPDRLRIFVIKEAISKCLGLGLAAGIESWGILTRQRRSQLAAERRWAFELELDQHTITVISDVTDGWLWAVAQEQRHMSCK